MDISKTYIKMCEEAEEIQRLRTSEVPDYEGGTYKIKEYLIGDYYLHEGIVQAASTTTSPVIPDEESNVWTNVVDSVWLPRQDQLQEMVELPLKETIYRFSLWAMFYANQFTSMEQLWLAFVLKEKYNKVWDGETWQIHGQ